MDFNYKQKGSKDDGNMLNMNIRTNKQVSIFKIIQQPHSTSIRGWDTQVLNTRSFFKEIWTLFCDI